MTVQPTRDQLRADVATGKALTGTHRADSDRNYYPAMKRIFEAVPQLLDQLDQAEARIKAVRDTLLASDDGTEYDHNGHQPFEGEPECPGCWVEGIRRALDGD